MDNRYIISLILIVGVLLGSVIVSVADTSQAVQQDQEVNKMHVSGSGEVEIDPDQVIIELGVEVTEDTAQKAREKNAQQTDSVIKAIKSLGIPEDQLETVRFSLYEKNQNPRIEKEEEQESKPNYRAVNTIRITSNDTDKAAKIIDTAIAKGANDVDKVSFTLRQTTREEAREQAVKKAVSDAEKEAQNAAQEMSIKLNGPVNIDVSSTGFRTYTPHYELRGGDGKVSLPAEDAATPIQPGKVTVTANIDVTYGFTATAQE